MTRAQISKGVIVLLVLVAGISIWWQQHQLPQIPVQLKSVSCQPAKGDCNVMIDGGQLQWRVESPLQYLKAFPSHIRLLNIADKDVLHVSMDFVMRGMEMAVNRSDFKRKSAGVWQTESVLPICASGRKDWLAIVRLETRQGVWQVGFEFTLSKK